MNLENLYKKIDSLIEKYGNESYQLINIMQEIQKEYRYLPQEALAYISKQMDITEAKIYGVATFYENFSLKAKGEFVIKLCDGTACHVRKSIPILNALRKELKLTEENNTTEDMKFTVETVSCLGACGLAPVITINDKVFPKMTPETTVEIVRKIKEEGLC